MGTSCMCCGTSCDTFLTLQQGRFKKQFPLEGPSLRRSLRLPWYPASSPSKGLLRSADKAFRSSKLTERFRRQAPVKFAWTMLPPVATILHGTSAAHSQSMHQWWVLSGPQAWSRYLADFYRCAMLLAGEFERETPSRPPSKNRNHEEGTKKYFGVS